jgi:hypothetical protein
MPEPTIATLRQAIETIRAQIPKGELTRQSVERLLAAAEAVCDAGDGRPDDIESPDAPRLSKRQEERLRWAKIARQNAREQRRSSLEGEA